MDWDQPVQNGFEGLNSFWTQIAPYLFPIALILFLGTLLVLLVKKVYLNVS